ncbi:MAG TPA: hypothetical protein VJN18_15710, partial [Polyangiaceae bacterium]|nr:hypothetical protein [Polyangiaceae bacterium]
MFQGQARWFLLAGLSSSAFLGCSGEEPAGGGNAGNSPGGTSAGSGVQGGAGGAGGTSGGAAGSMSAGTGGGGAASGGMGGGAGGSGGSGGNAGGSAGSGGSGGTGMPTAVANITAILGGGVTGTATFTQGAMMTKLVINLTACPDGAHATHLHET